MYMEVMELFRSYTQAAWSQVYSKSNLDQGGSVSNGQKIISAERSGWKTIRIFVSSTFKDFYPEREILVKEVFPQLRVWCEDRQLHLIECDLRWGVPEHSPTEVTLYACLSEIERCYEDNKFPFFISMTGERVGWVPKINEVPDSIESQFGWFHGLSVTEMEIANGAFRCANPNAIFMLRDPQFLKYLPPKHLDAFNQNTSEAKIKLEFLRRQIEQRFSADQKFRYPCKYDGENIESDNIKLSNMEFFKHTVLEFFKQRIEAQYPPLAANPDVHVVMRQNHTAFMKDRAKSLVGRKSIITEILGYIFNPQEICVPLLIVGETGCGKTSILASVSDSVLSNVGDGYETSGQDRILIYHFVGSTPNSSTTSVLVKRILNEISPDEMNHTDCANHSALLHSLLCSELTKPVVVIVDAINQLEDSSDPTVFQWIPQSLSTNVRLVLSVTPESVPHRLLTQRTAKPICFDVLPMEKEWKEDMVKSILGQYNKLLSTEQMKPLLAKRSSSNPLWLSIAIEELRVFGLYKSIMSKIGLFPDDLIELEISVIERFESQIGQPLVSAALCFLECSSKGLLETELKSLLGEGSKSLENAPLNAFEFSALYSTLKPFIRPFGDKSEGRLSIYHQSMRYAIQKRYFLATSNGETTASPKIQYHSKLADYFKSVRLDERKAEEYPYHLVQSRRTSELTKCLCDWAVIRQLFNEDLSRELIGFWLQCPGGLYAMEENYTELVDSYSKGQSQSEYWERLEIITTVLAQGGRLTCANKLAAKLLDLEVKIFGCRSEKLADIYWLKGQIEDKISRATPYLASVSQYELAVRNYEQLVSLTDVSTCSDKEKRRLGKSLTRLGYLHTNLSNAMLYFHKAEHGDEILTELCSKAVAVAKEAVELFSELGDEIARCDALITRGFVAGRAEHNADEALKCYTLAERTIVEHMGDKYFLLERLYVNMGIHYESVGDNQAAYTYNRMWFKLCNDIYGLNHSLTKGSIDILNNPKFVQIAGDRGDEIPELHLKSLEEALAETNGFSDNTD